MKRQINSAGGFTWIEILVVFVILTILACLTVPRYCTDNDESRVRRTKIMMTELMKALELYKQDNGHYPTTEQGLRALVDEPESEAKTGKWKQFLDKVPFDLWRNEFIYTSPVAAQSKKTGDSRIEKAGNSNGYDLKSKGYDGTEGTKDDIDCWNMDAVPD
jgi:general secretion pathway protein G